MGTIEIEKELFLDMIDALLNEVAVEKQVAWLQEFGMVFYDQKLYDYVESKHKITTEFFQKAATAFWGDDTVLFKKVTYGTLNETIDGIYYQNYLGFSFDSKKTVSDISYGLEAYGKDPAKRYFSPMLFHCLAAAHGLDSDSELTFTKVLLPNFEMTIVCAFQTTDGVKYMDFSQNPW